MLGVNTRLELAELDAKLRDRKARELMEAGTTIFRPETCDIDADVEIGTDTVIEPFVQLIGKTKIGADCRIRSYSVITNCEIGDGVLILPGCMLEDSVVRDGAQLGSVLTSAARQRHRRRSPRRQLRRDQEDAAGQGLEGQSPHLSWRLPRSAKA